MHYIALCTYQPISDKLHIEMKASTDKSKQKEKGWEFLALSVFNAIIGVALLACPTITFTASDPLPPFALWFQRAMIIPIFITGSHVHIFLLQCLVQAVICGLIYHFSKKLLANNSYIWHCKCFILIAVIVVIGDFISIIIINFVYVGILAGTEQGKRKNDNGLEYLVLVFVGLSFAANILTVYECRVFGSWIKELSKGKNKPDKHHSDTVEIDKTGGAEVKSRDDVPRILELETQNSLLRQEIAILQVEQSKLQYDQQQLQHPSTPPPKYSRKPYLETEI